MSHPVVTRAEKLIGAGDIVGAEAALTSLIETDGDDALVVALDDLAAKDLLAVLREHDSSKESVVGLLVSPEQFARARPSSSPGQSSSNAAMATPVTSACGPSSTPSSFATTASPVNSWKPSAQSMKAVKRLPITSAIAPTASSISSGPAPLAISTMATTPVPS